MPWQLTFDSLISYDAGKAGISVSARLQSGATIIDVPAKIDTGSTYCIFERMYGEDLGLNIEAGHRQIIGTATGSFIAYGHEVTLTVEGYCFNAIVYFPEDPSINRNVLGRHGFLDRFQLGLIDYEGKLFLSRFGDNGGV